MLKIAKLNPSEQKSPMSLDLEGPEETPSLPEDSTAEPIAPTVVIPKALVVYMTGDMGPFKCSNCCYFNEPGSCSVVEGDIDPEGCCNMYCPPEGAHSAPSDEEMMEPEDNPEEEAAEEEPPVE